MEWVEVIGSQPEKPEEIDTTSSKFIVYERKDIKPYEEEDKEQTGFKWTYKERQIPREQWILDQTKANHEDLVALLSGLIDLYELNAEL